jgi:hypothetical protein
MQDGNKLMTEECHLVVRHAMWLVRTDDSEGHMTFTIKLGRSGELGTTLAVTELKRTALHT